MLLKPKQCLLFILSLGKHAHTTNLERNGAEGEGWGEIIGDFRFLKGRYTLTLAYTPRISPNRHLLYDTQNSICRNKPDDFENLFLKTCHLQGSCLVLKTEYKTEKKKFYCFII